MVSMVLVVLVKSTLVDELVEGDVLHRGDFAPMPSLSPCVPNFSVHQPLSDRCVASIRELSSCYIDSTASVFIEKRMEEM